ncbi:ABC transporter substrate-binding protein [Fundicoccus sp. Sow4_F4]|uniref:ABC transporter substrate-binding protein n=1 Tax=Fundicoccus sp. Sow4_F4 TaxID=3438783 RepID=UPI003F90D13C
MKLIKKIATIATSLSLLSVLATTPNHTVSAQEETPIKIGVLQHVEHEALNDAQQGFIDRMNEEYGDRIVWDIQNASGNIAGLQSLAEKLARESDILYAIATPAAQTLASVETQKPIFFSAVAAPLQAGLVDSMEEPGRNLTGTTNLGPIEDHVELLIKNFPEAKKIGILYNSSEVNAQHQVDIATKAMEAKELTPVLGTITSTNDIQQVLSSLLEEIDVLFMVTDNTVDSSIALVGDMAKEADVPTVGSSDSVVKANGLMTISNSYIDYGIQTAEMAIRYIEEDLTVAEMPVEIGENFVMIVNEEFAEEIGIEPSSLVGLD